MKNFVAPVDDILFSLHRVAEADNLPQHDATLCSDVLRQFAPFAEQVIAPTNQSGDREGCRLVDGRVRMPDGFCDVFRHLGKAGWMALTIPTEFDGMGVDGMTAAGVSEIFTGANHAMQMVCGLVPGAVSTLLRFGTPDQQQTWIPRLADGRVLNTMCLTEPGAGSDLGRIRTTAKQRGDGWAISGEKIFISGGDQDLSDEVLHFVLARTGAPDSGTRGLSLFLCPAIIDGVTNGVSVTRIESKLGIHASPTCQLAFDGARAELIGSENAGLKAMFTLMNHARIDVALQGTAHAVRASDIARTYAEMRTQGRGDNGAPAQIVDHPDVRQMLDEQRALTVGGRAMCHLALKAVETPGQEALADFLTPVCKVFASEAGIRAADLGIQIMGGYGYLEEYHMAQTWRDARITSIYEGANGIHALGTATRGLRHQNGAGADAFAAMVASLAEGNAEIDTLLARWQEARRAVLAEETVPPQARQFVLLTGELFFRAAWVKVAKAAIGTGFETEFTRLMPLVLASPIPEPRFST